MNQLEENVVHSFRLAKSDIIKLHNNFLKLSQSQERLMEMIEDLNSKELHQYQRSRNVNQAVALLIKNEEHSAVKKVAVKASKPKSFLSTKEGKLFHIKNCPFAQNIKPKNKVTFKTKAKALNKGLKPCKCIK